MNEKLVAHICEYAHKIYDEKLFGESTNNISVKVDEESIYITKTGVNFNEITDKDVIEVKFAATDKCPTDTLKEALMHINIYNKRPDLACIMVTSPISSLTVANSKVTIKPALDDMAQIVGVTAKTAKTNDVFAIVKALKGRGACLLSGIGSLSTGKTLNEAFTSCLVLDKAAHTLIMATAVGGCKPVSKIGAILEHKVYQMKYSKSNQEALLAAERE